VQPLITRLDDKDKGVRRAVVEALGVSPHDVGRRHHG